MNSGSDAFPVQGDNEYGINFELDYDVFAEGTHSYAPYETYSDGPLRMGGGRSGYSRYYTLAMDFRFKDGRTFHEEVDIEALMKDLASREEIFDNRRTEWGGGAIVEVKISSREMVIDYIVRERILEPDYEINNYRYPLYRKELK